jgi:hypothetical protein
MMDRLKSDQSQLFYEFCLGDADPEDHLVRMIDPALDLSWHRSELGPHYSSSPVDRSGADDPDAGRGVCLCDLRRENSRASSPKAGPITTGANCFRRSLPLSPCRTFAKSDKTSAAFVLDTAFPRLACFWPPGRMDTGQNFIERGAEESLQEPGLEESRLAVCHISRNRPAGSLPRALHRQPG